MDALTLFGLGAVTAMLFCYAFESRGAWVTLAFALSCAMSSLYGFLQGAWPIGVVEAIWALVALIKWRGLPKRSTTPREGPLAPSKME